MFHPLMRVWIEIFLAFFGFYVIKFHPLMRVWIEILSLQLGIVRVKVSPSYEGVD